MQNIENLNNLFLTAIKTATDSGALQLPDNFEVDPGLERPKDDAHGDFACTIAMRMAKTVGMAPRDIAQIIIDNFPENSDVEKMEIAGPGFINLYLKNESVANIVQIIREKRFDFAKDCAKGLAKDLDKKINLEYISANPTGPMHVGHGR